MKRLTISRVARANIRINRKAYMSLFIGILVAVFLATATSLCAWGAIRGHEEQMAQRVGWMDMFILGEERVTDNQLRRSGFFREIGHVTVNAAVEGRPVCAGYYDETAGRLLNRTMKEGRLPEKPGEIAAEQSALIRMDLDAAKTGDTLTLTMTPYCGVSEEKQFTLVGILNEQTPYLETWCDEGCMRFPALLTSPDETYATGETAVHRVLTYAPLITKNQVDRNCPIRLDMSFGVSREKGTVIYSDSGWDRAANALNRVLIWTVLGAALMLSACIAITSSMESLLARKTEDIGMLRAIGATKRQIRSVYGTEAWLLTVTALPAGLLLGLAFAWTVSRIAPEQMSFSPAVWLLIPVLGLSALCVFIASRVPLYHAARQMPMGVLRDTALLQKAGRIRNHTSFRPERLIAGRRTRLHPLRQLGAACMIALTLMSTLMLGELAMGMRITDDESLSAFRLTSEAQIWTDEPFTQLNPENVMTGEGLSQLKAIDGVSRVRSFTTIKANLLMEKAPEYFRTYHYDTKEEDGTVTLHSFSVLDQTSGGSDWLFWNEEELADARARKEENWSLHTAVLHVDQMNMIRKQLGFTEKIVPVNLYAADLDEDLLREYIEDGSIDKDKLDSGEQVLIYAPTFCMKEEEGRYFGDVYRFPREVREEDWDLVIRNDVFTAGMPLELLELAGKGAETLPWEPDEYDLKTYYTEKEAVRIRTTVGAVLTGPVKISDTYIFSFAVITTHKGAEALRLKMPGPDYTDVWLSGDPTPEREEEIAEKIGQVALHGWMDVENRLKVTRDYRDKKLHQILLFSGLILLFFAVSVFMQVSGTTRQIRSETRTIGTLRAVGADLKTLVRCYRIPVIICAAAGLVPCLLFYAVTEIPGARVFTQNHPAIMIPVLLFMAACVTTACIAGIRSRLAAVTRQSIVDNIREL